MEHNKRNILTLTCLIFLLLHFQLSWGYEFSNKIGPLLRKAIIEKKNHQTIKPRVEKKELTKVIVVMNCDHLSKLSEKTLNQFKKKVEQLEGILGNHAFNNIQVWLPIDNLNKLAEWSEIKSINKPLKPKLNNITSQGIYTIGANYLHSVRFNGEGIKIGVIDIGFKDYDLLLGKELPVSTTVYKLDSHEAFVSDLHGTACAEIVYDIVPNAKLYLVNVPDIRVGFSNAVSWLKAQGVNTVSSSIGINLKIKCELVHDALYSNIYAALDNMNFLQKTIEQWDIVINDLIDNGTTWVQAAGNNGQKQWKGWFTDPDLDGYLNFNANINYNPILLPPSFNFGLEIYVLMTWNLENGGSTFDDYNLYITDKYGYIISSSIISQSSIPYGMEACKFKPIPNVDYYLFVHRASGRSHEVSILLGSTDLPRFEYYNPQGTVRQSPPSCNPNVITVGAVPWSYPSTIESFSSQGPTKDGFIKPDLVGPDAVSTQSYGNMFYGTSAATPHVAGACALVKQIYPHWSPTQIKTYLKLNAFDKGVSGQDNIFGSGLINLESLNPFKYTIFYPHIATVDAWETEICIINTGEESINGIFMPYGNNGLSVSDSIRITLSAHSRKKFIIGSDFIDASRIGYILFHSESDHVVGYTKFFVDGLCRVAVPAVSEVTMDDLYISHLASNSQWFTGISLVNTKPSVKNLSIEFNTGITKNITLSGYQHLAFSISSLFDNIPQVDLESAIIRGAAGVVGLELFGSFYQLSGILLKNDISTDMVYPHIASDKNWWTGIVAYNPSNSLCALTVTPFSADGKVLPSQLINLGGFEKYIGTAKSLKLPSGSAWFKLQSSKPITGFELFGTHDGKLLAGYTGVEINHLEGVFPKIEKKGWTGIAFVNTNMEQATVNLTAYDDSGNIVDTKSIVMPGYSKIVNVAESIFSQNINNATYIRYSSNYDIVGFQLNGSSDGMLLDGLPGM